MPARDYHHGDLRRSLIAEAAALIASEGERAASLRAVARRAGVSHAAPAHHFRDKAGLLAALAAEGHRDLAARMAAVADHPDPAQALLGAGLAYLALAREQPGHFAVMARCDLADPVRHPELAAAGAASSGVLARIIARLAGPAQAAAQADAAWGLAHGLAVLAASGALGAPAEAQARATAALGGFVERLRA